MTQEVILTDDRHKAIAIAVEALRNAHWLSYTSPLGALIALKATAADYRPLRDHHVPVIRASIIAVLAESDGVTLEDVQPREDDRLSAYSQAMKAMVRVVERNATLERPAQ